MVPSWSIRTDVEYWWVEKALRRRSRISSSVGEGLGGGGVGMGWEGGWSLE